jgi:hypothetical protein
VNIIAGLGWKVEDSRDYTRLKLGVTVPFDALPKRAQTKLWASLANVAAGISWDTLAASIGYVAGPESVPFSADELATGTAYIMHFLDRCEVTLLTNFERSDVEAILSCNVLKSVGEDELERVSVNASQSFQVWPWQNNVPFE